jgi:hypothetical protein
MLLIQKCRRIIKIAEKYGTPMARSKSFDYWGVEVIRSTRRHQWHVILPFVLNVSVRNRSIKFHAGDEYILNYLFEKLPSIADE